MIKISEVINSNFIKILGLKFPDLMGKGWMNRFTMRGNSMNSMECKKSKESKLFHFILIRLPVIGIERYAELDSLKLGGIFRSNSTQI